MMHPKARTFFLTKCFTLLTVTALQISSAYAGYQSQVVGAINGDFAVSEGQLSYALPFSLPAGAHNLAPSVGIKYSQNAGNGIVGVGFTLTGLEAITRCTATKQVDGFAGGIGFNNKDRYCLNGARLIARSGSEGSVGTEYRLLSDNFTKVVSNGGTANNPASWTVYYPNGYIATYGGNSSSRETLDNKVFSWRLSERKNRFNQKIVYTYLKDNTVTYLNKISYSGYEVTFNYEDRPDIWEGYRNGVKQRVAKRLESVDVYNLRDGSNLLKSYKLTYGYAGALINLSDPMKTPSRLESVSLCDAQNDCTPPVTFQWQKHQTGDFNNITQKHLLEVDEPKVYVNGDLNNDGRVDICYYDDAFYCSLQNEGGFDDAYKASNALDKPVTDLPEDNDALRALGVEDWSKPEKLATLTILDINADGFSDYCALGDIGVFCGTNNGQGSFEDERYWFQELTIDDGVRFIDMDNDRLTDACAFSDNGVKCYKNTGSSFSNTSKNYNDETFTWPIEKQIEHKFVMGGNTEMVSAGIKLPQPQMFDVNGDGYVDICGFDYDGAYKCAIGNNNETLSLSPKRLWGIELTFGQAKTTVDKGVKGCPFHFACEFFVDEERAKHEEEIEKELEEFDDRVRPFRYADINSDGLVDVCYRSDDDYKCQINSGTEFLPATVWHTFNNDEWEEGDWREAYENNIRLSDVNHDGITDFCSIVSNNLKCAYGNGSNFGSQFDIDEPVYVDIQAIKGEAYGYTKPAKKLFGLRTLFKWTVASTVFGPFKNVGDATGNGMADMCYRSTTGITCIDNTQVPLARLLGVTNSYGVKAAVEYDLAANLTVSAESESENDWVDSVANQLVVASLINESSAGTSRVDYEYGPYRRNLELGTGGYTRLVKHNRLNSKTVDARYMFTPDGQRLLDKTITKVGGTTVAIATNQYEKASRDDSRSIVYRQTYSHSEAFELDGSALPTSDTYYDDYDAFDNVGTLTQVTTDVSGKTWTKTSRTEYSNNISTWLLSKPTRIEVTHQSPTASNVVRATEFEYDYQTGALKTEIIEPNSNNAKTITNTYNNAGFLTSSAVSTKDGTRRSHTEYDQWGRVISSANAKQQRVSQTYHPVCGAVETTTDANDNQSTYIYDASCRLVRQEAPDGSWAEWEYAWSSGIDLGVDDQQLGLDLADTSVYKVTETSSTGFWSTTWYDQNDRPIRVANWADSEQIVLQDTTYNALGQVVGQSLPYFDNSVTGANHWVLNEYDILGRLVKRSTPGQYGERLAITVEHDGLTTTENSPLGRTKIITKNAVGETVQVNENGSDIFYEYNSVGELKRVNAAGIITTLEYDEFGNKTAQNDPAMGRWTYEYNAFGELVKQIDGKGQTVQMQYDILGRIVKRLEKEGQTIWTYDAAENGIGLPTSVQSPNVSRQYMYDDIGRIEAQKTTIQGREFVTGFGYDDNSRLISVFNPDGTEVRHDYNAAGQRTRVGLPKSDVWDYDYLALEDAFMATFKRIQELDKIAADYEGKIEELTAEAEKYRHMANQYEYQAGSAEHSAKWMRGYAKQAEEQAIANAQLAENYRKRAEFYWKAFGNTTLKYVKTRNGMARYEAKFCVSKNWKGHCKRHQTYRADIPAQLVQQTSYCGFPSKFGQRQVCSSGPQKNLHVGKLYDDLHLKYEKLAKQNSDTAAQYHSYANGREDAQKEYEAKAADMQKRAEDYMARARDHAEQLSVISEELKQQKVAYNELQQAIDERQNDQSNVYLWRATGYAANGQLTGELYGNGLQTSRSIHSGTGLIENITTKRGGQILHTTAYQYDQRANVVARNDLGTGNQPWQVDQTYGYDYKDRLTNWSLTDGSGYQQSSSYYYDNRNNLRFKSDAGDMQFNQANQLTKRISPSGESYSYNYDANGNQLSGDGRNIAWTSFNKASRITQNGLSAEFLYDENHTRALRKEGDSVTYYVTANFEQTETIENGKTITKNKHTISNGYETAVVYEKTLIQGKKQADKVSYLHRDAQGTATLITSGNGEIVQRRVTKPFGGDLPEVGNQTAADYNNSANKGYTGHEHLPNFGLINMNARLYDPLTGRFLSADSVIPDPTMAAAYNRYAYVYNNPTRYVDPTGHWVQFVIGAIIFAIGATSDDEAVSTIGMVVGAILMGAGAAEVTGASGSWQAAAANGALVGSTSNFITSGGDVGEAVEGGVMGAVKGAVTYEIGHGFGGEKGLNFNDFERGLAHGIFQGGLAELNGGSFKDGFIGGAVGHWAGGIGESAFGDVATHTDWSDIIGRTAISAIAGGLVADATGGDFAQGAMTAAFVHLFNTEGKTMKSMMEDLKERFWGTRRIVIGENMTYRVEPFAEKIGAETYQPSRWFDDDELHLLFRENIEWLMTKMDEGYLIIDIGPDPESSYYPMPKPDPYYPGELMHIFERGYPRYYPIWGTDSLMDPGTLLREMR